MTRVGAIIATAGGTSWATPAWSVVTLLLGALLAAVTSLILYLLRRADASAKRADDAEQDAVIEWRKGVNSRIDALLGSSHQTNVGLDRLREDVRAVHADHGEFKLKYERRLSRVEGHVFGARAGDADALAGGVR